MNIKILRKIQRKIMQEPRQFVMRRFFAGRAHVLHDIPNCGTAACIAGWALSLDSKVKYKGRIKPEQSLIKELCYTQIVARTCEILDINITQGNRLFNVEHWPAEFNRSNFDALDPFVRADLACRRIDYFIKTGE